MAMHIRVIAGEFRGRRLLYPAGRSPAERSVRPTMERTRASVFSTLEGRIRGVVFADLFAAAGAVGIEALSRGAALVHFVENDPSAIDCLRRNLEACRVPAEMHRIHETDVFSFLERGGLSDAAAKVVYADPPYSGDETARLLSHFERATYGQLSVLVVEHGGALEVRGLGALESVRTRRFGETSVTYWERRG
jgi:16S rRNA (guanine966-N2)-methyltransferase